MQQRIQADRRRPLAASRQERGGRSLRGVLIDSPVR
jgi:hypothetical protein